MPTNVEIRPQEVFKSLESWKRWFMTILLLMLFAVVSTDVDASDAESVYNNNQTITITVENLAAFYDSLNGSSDVELPMNPERETPEVNIRGGVNVRSLDSSAGTINSFPRGNAEVIGWFGATSGDNFGRIAAGLWFVVENAGQTGAVYSGLVSQSDGTPLTADELNAAGVPQFTFEMGVPTPPAPEEPEVEASPTGEASEEGEDGVEVAMAPETLSVPEVPATIQFRNRTLLQIFRGEQGSAQETITVNQGNVLPMPLGLISRGQSEITDSVSVWEEGNRDNEEWRRIPLSGIVLSVDQEPGTEVYYITMRTATSNGVPFTALIRMEGFVRFSPVNDQLGLTISQDQANLLEQVNTRFATDRITGPTRQIIPGDNITLTIFDVAEPHNNPFGITHTVNSTVNGVSDGTPSNIFRQIELGNIDAENAIVYAAGTGTIIYNQD
ncbi:hypothetical protein KJZ63_04430 [Patescibacteria group bacterium]|nr:hypothetical protein [Patescibacteria group bacterium]